MKRQHFLKWMGWSLLFIIICFQFVQTRHLGQCSYFQETKYCNSLSNRKYQLHHNCNETIDSSLSGYCKCKDNWRTVELKCGHQPTSCEMECNKCIGWRGTMNCSPYSNRDISSDLGCNDLVPQDSSGYCLCENGRRTAFSDCHHTPFTCRQQCAFLPRRICPVYNSSLRSSSATGCNGKMTLQNHVNSEVSIYVLDDKGIDNFLTTIPKSGTYTIHNFCVPFSIRVFSMDMRVIYFQQSVNKLSTYSFPITICYEEEQLIHKDTLTTIKAPSFQFEMKWGIVRGISQPFIEGSDETLSILQPLSSILQGYNKTFTWKHSIECPYCKEHLQHHSKTCPRCHGVGIERIQHSLQSIEKQEIQTTCPLCHGYGKIPSDSSYHCSYCNNTHVLIKTISEQAFIPEGAPEGYRIVFKGKGDQQPFSHPGNMIYTLHYALPTGYSIQKNDLIYEKRITVKEMKEKQQDTLETPFGRQVIYDYPTNQINDDTSIVIKGEGLPILGQAVHCKQFVVTHSYNSKDNHNRSCKEKIPHYLTGYCECDNRKVYYTNSLQTKGLINCYHPSLCGTLSRGDLIIHFSLKNVFE